MLKNLVLNSVPWTKTTMPLDFRSELIIEEPFLH